MPRPVTLLPSLLSCDFARIAEELAACEADGARMLHVDCMDGHFVPNITIGPLVVEAMRRSTRLPLDVHLMLSRPLDYVDAFRKAGADMLYVHAEAIGPRTILDGIERVRATGAQVGLAFNPDTDPMLWRRAIERVDAVMVMTVYPGFGGQAFIPDTRPRIRALRQAFPGLPIQVDGGIDRETMREVVADGADRLVVGSAFFRDADRPGFIRSAQALRAP